MAAGVLALLAALAFATAGHAQEPDATRTQILALIDAVANSGCRFERNGKTYDAEKAADHLRLKYRRGRKYADSPETFIDRLASKSSMSGKPYHMQCPGEPRVTTGEWLHAALRTLRGTGS